MKINIKDMLVAAMDKDADVALASALTHAGYRTYPSELNTLSHAMLTAKGSKLVMIAIFENWENTQVIVDEYGDEDYACTYVIDTLHFAMTDGELGCEYGGCGEFYNDMGEAMLEMDRHVRECSE